MIRDCSIYALVENFTREIMGNAFETSLFSEFVKNKGSENIYYWRTQDKKEIDFIIVQKEKLIPVEIKINAVRMNYTPVKYFCSNYEVEKAFCIGLEGELPEDKANVIHINPWEYSFYF